MSRLAVRASVDQAQATPVRRYLPECPFSTPLFPCSSCCLLLRGSAAPLASACRLHAEWRDRTPAARPASLDVPPHRTLRFAVRLTARHAADVVQAWPAACSSAKRRHTSPGTDVPGQSHAYDPVLKCVPPLRPPPPLRGPTSWCFSPEDFAVPHLGASPQNTPAHFDLCDANVVSDVNTCSTGTYSTALRRCVHSHLSCSQCCSTVPRCH